MQGILNSIYSRQINCPVSISSFTVKQNDKVMHKGCGLIFLLVIGSGLFAQKSDLDRQLESIENSNAHEANIIWLKKILTQPNLSVLENIAVQTVLVHKYQQLKQWDTCLNYCQAQIALAQKQDNKLTEATFYKLLGNTCYHIPDKEKALAYWKKCIAISETINQNLLLEQCYHNIGSVILESGENYDEAERNFQKAIQLSVSNKTDTTQLGNLHYRLLATLYRETGRIEKADALYTTVIVRARQLNDSLRIAEALMFYAVLLSDEKKFDKAIETGKEALLISQQFNKLDMEQTALGLLSSNYAQVGSQMALLSNNVENLDTNYRKQLGIDENIDRVKDTSKQLLQTLRETIWILNKGQVSAEDFFDKLVEYANRFLQSYPGVLLRVNGDFVCNKKLNSNEALQLFRICQEAITNSCKYAESEVLELYGKTEQEIFTISIRDFGKGFDANSISGEGHYGLKNMRKRAAVVNANLQIFATTGKGVTVTIKV